MKSEEEIRKLAETYAKTFFRWPNLESGHDRECCIKGFIAGAHSRDEEIEQLGNDYHDMFLTLANKVEQLRNPWIRVEDRLPEEDPDDKGYSVEVFGLFPYDSVSKCFCKIEEGIWFIDDCVCEKPTHWMPIPKLQNLYI